MVKLQLPKLVLRVRFPSSAPCRSKVRFAPAYFFAYGRKISHPPVSLLWQSIWIPKFFVDGKDKTLGGKNDF